MNQKNLLLTTAVFIVLSALAPAHGGHNAAPSFATPLPSSIELVGGVVTIGIDGFDPDGDALTISVASDNPNLRYYIPEGNRSAIMHFTESDGVTPIGDILVQLFEGRSPLATERFIMLSENEVNPDGSLNPSGTPFYTNVPVHRVIPDFIIQSGDAENGNGTGGSPLGYFANEAHPTLTYSGPGMLGTANAGPNTNDSQFFITDAATPWLYGAHTVFGQMINGWDVLDDIINRPASGSSPDDPPLLSSVDIIYSPDTGTLTLLALGELEGPARVTVTLDDGNGGTVSQVIVVPEPTSAVLLVIGIAGLLRRKRK